MPTVVVAADPRGKLPVGDTGGITFPAFLPGQTVRVQVCVTRRAACGWNSADASPSWRAGGLSASVSVRDLNAARRARACCVHAGVRKSPWHLRVWGEVGGGRWGVVCGAGRLSRVGVCETRGLRAPGCRNRRRPLLPRAVLRRLCFCSGSPGGRSGCPAQEQEGCPTHPRSLGHPLP